MRTKRWVLAAMVLLVGACTGEDPDTDTGPDPDTDTEMDTDSDTDTEMDTDTDSDSEADTDPDTDPDTDTSDGTCAPYVDDPACADAERCFPDASVRGTGQCTANPSGTAVAGDVCGSGAPEQICGTAELLCTAQSASESYCREVCDPAATGEEPGQCDSSMACSPLTVGNDELAYGVCVPTCRYAPGDPLNPIVACPGDDVCLPAYLVSSPFDVCVSGYDASLVGAPLDVGAVCPVGADFLSCRPNALCLDLGDGLQCTEMCSDAVGDGIGSAAHPECSTTGAVCEALGATADYGACQVPDVR